MEDLIASIAADAGVEPGIAKKSVGMILAFLRNEGPKDEVDALFAVLPGAAEAADAVAEEDGVGAFADAMGGGLMGLAGRLTSLGLGMGRCRRSGGKSSPMYARKPGTSESVRSYRRFPVLGSFFSVPNRAAFLSS